MHGLPGYSRATEAAAGRSRPPTILLSALAAALLLSLASPAGAAEIAVTTKVDSLSADGACSLREAVRNANLDARTHPDCAAGSGADTITLPAGKFTLTIVGRGEDAALKGDLDLVGDLTIAGAGMGQTVVTAGSDRTVIPRGLDRLFDVRPGARVALSGLSVAHGDPMANVESQLDNGAGIRSAGDLRLADVQVFGSAATAGGGVHSKGGTLVVQRSVIRNNKARLGAGGGILASDGPLSVSTSEIRDNTASLAGGGVYFGGESGQAATITSSTISGNVAGPSGGGGVGVFPSSTSATPSAEVTNVTLSGNVGEALLAGVRSTVAVNHATITGASGDAFTTYRDATISLRGSIVTDGLCNRVRSPHIVSRGLNLTFPCLLGGPGDLTGQASLGPLADNGGLTRTHALLPGSAALNRIPLQSVRDGVRLILRCITGVVTDQRGFPRFRRPTERCDIGAFERTG